MLTCARIHELLIYDPETGIMRWRVTKSNFRGAGKIAGGPSIKKGRWRIMVDGRRYLRARLAWFMTHGRWPVGDCEHKDTDCTNDRLSNLREATRSQNVGNTGARKHSKTGRRGVFPRKGKFIAQINALGVKRHLGTFATADEAEAAYRAAAKIEYGEFAHGDG